MAGFDTKEMMNRAIRYMAQTAMERAAGGWVPPKERERQQREAMRAEEKQARQAEKEKKEAARAHEKEQKLLSKQFPTQYMPNVGRQVMQDGGVPDPNAPKPLSQIINRNQDIMPSIGDPTPEELSAARADTRVGRDIVANRLNTIVPESERVVGGKYRPGAPGGGRWSDLPPEVLNSPGRGFNVTDEELQNLWRQSLEESSEAAKKAANDNQVAPKFLAKDWDKAMRLPLSDHLWYELSGEKMAENMPDLTHSEFLKLMDLIGATSARAKPGENLERSLAALSQYLRNAPIDVDLTIPETVRQALGRSQEGSSALPGNKTGYFSDTLALTGGVPTRMPISVNDVWVGKMFGVPDNVMSSNQSLHEPMAKYFNKIRDLYNERHGHEVPFPYQSWNFQAPAWVHLRGEEAGMESGDAYHQVWDSIINKLKDKNIPGVTGNSISREALMHPDFADALRRTTAPFRSAPKATVEFGTKLTNVGQTAHDHYQRAIAANDELSQNEYLSGLTKAMYASARGEGHPWERLKKAITGTLGQGGDITRIANPTSESPLDIGGTFEGDVSPNIRVPLKDMSDDQIAYFNAVAGKHLKQKAMAASYVLDPEGPDSPPREGHIRGYSAFVPTTEGMDPADIRAFAKELSKIGHDTSYARYPNGYRFDIIPNFNLDTPKGIDHAELADAYDATLVNKYGAPAILAHDFKSVYTPDTEYDGLKSKLIKEIKSDFIKQAQEAGIPISAARKILADPSLSGGLKGRSAKAWDTYSKRIDHLSSAEQGFKDLAQRVSDAHSTFITKAEKRQKKYRDGFREGGSVYEPHQRAEEQGYSIRGYHVTRGRKAEQISSAKRFDPYMAMSPGEEATFFWDSPHAANEWASHMIGEQSFDPQTMSERGIDRAERHATSVMPVRIHPGKSATIDWMEATGQPHYNNRKMAQIIRNARDLGFDTIRIKNMIEGEMLNAPQTPEEMASYKPADQIAVLNPHVIRSEFAEFDPQKFGRDDLGAARGGGIRDHLGFGGVGEGPISGATGSAAGNSYSGSSSMADARAADRASVSGYSADSGGGGGGGGGFNSGNGRDSSSSRNRDADGRDRDRDKGDLGIGGPQGITGAAAFGRPEQGTGTYNLDSQLPMTIGRGMGVGQNIGAEFVADAVKPDFSMGNSPLASGISSYDRSKFDARMDRMRADQQAERDQSYERSVVGPTMAQINVPNAGDLYGASNAPLAVNQQPSGMFGQPEFGATKFGQNPLQSGFPKQSDVQTRSSAPFSQPNRPITPTPFSSYPQEVQNALNPVKPDSAFGRTLIDPTGKYTNQALEQMNVASDGLAMLNSPTLAGAFVRAFTPTPTPATPQQQAAIERMYRGSLNTGVPSNFGTPEGMAQRYGAPGATPLPHPGQTSTAYLTAGPSASSGRQDLPVRTTSASPAPAASNMTPRQNFEKAFSEARARGDSVFTWTNPKTGRTMRYTTKLERKAGGRVPSVGEHEQWECKEK